MDIDMQITEIFQVLGIEATKDAGAIKAAYREKLAVTNPEDNPEGFKRLRTAYEEACEYAAKTDEDAPPERDETPSGLWVEKAADIYRNIITRQDREKWKEMFDEDIFLSLEEEENCRYKFLRFLMDHFRLPTDIWNLFDEKLNLKEDAQRLREAFPADFIRYVLNKCERGEDVDFTQFEGEPEAEYDLYLQYYDRCWGALQEKQYEQAEEYIKNADDLGIYHPVIEVCRAHLWVAREQAGRAIEHMEKLYERYPKDSMVCYNAAEIMWRHEQKEKAAQIYRELKDANDKHYMANVRLAEWHYENGRYEEAKNCAEKVLSLGADDQFMELLAKINKELEKTMEEQYRNQRDAATALELGWCYLQDGRVSQGIRLAESLKEGVPEDRKSEHLGLLTKLYMEETDYEKAIAMAERWVAALQERLDSDEPEEEKEKDRDRVRQYHMIRMQIFRALGDMNSTKSAEVCRKNYEKALSEADGLMDGSSQDIGFLLEKAQIYLDMGEYEKSLEMTRILVQEYQVYAAFATEIEVYRREWNASGVVQAGRHCINSFPDYVRAYEQVAKVFLDLDRKEDLQSILDEAKERQIQSPILEAYRYQMKQKPPETEELDRRLAEFRKTYFPRVESGDMDAYREGLPILTEYLYWYPGTYMLVERGLFHRAARHYEEAREDFEKALAENPRQPYALNGLSFNYKYQGDYEKALIYIKRTIRYKDPEMTNVVYSDMAALYSLLGNYEEAAAAYQKFIGGDKQKFGFATHKKYARYLASAGKKEDAANWLSDFYNSCEEDKKRHYMDDLVDFYQTAGMAEKAEALLQEWYDMLAKQKPAVIGNQPYAEYYIRLAWQNVLYQDGKIAAACYERALEYREMYTRDKWKLCGPLSDAVFVSIISGDHRRGKAFAAKLRLYMAKAKGAGQPVYENMDKQLAQTEFHARYYNDDWNGEEEKTLLEVGDVSEACHFCDYCICKELEAAWLLWLFRCGRKDEAVKRLTMDLERQPLDEYQLAIRHMLDLGCFDGTVSYEERDERQDAGTTAAQAELLRPGQTAQETTAQKTTAQKTTAPETVPSVERQGAGQSTAQETSKETGLLSRLKGVFQKKQP